MGRDASSKPMFCRAWSFQSTRPHGARLVSVCLRAATSVVSIHAPAWGATRRPLCRARVLREFQSTRPHGARLAALRKVHALGHVSIHAPAWGATLSKVASSTHLTKFQSTRPHGARLCRRTATCSDTRFNPRARMGRDAARRSRRVLGRVSIHAPAWGATCTHEYRRCCPSSFNPRARMGRDVQRIGVARLFWVSIHAPAWGATRDALACRPSLSRFQSTRPHGARLSEYANV